MSACLKCGVSLIRQRTWHAMTPATRATTEGKCHGGRGLCSLCYSRARYYGLLIDYERGTRPRTEVVEELYQLGLDDRLPIKPQLRNLAPRLGLSYAAVGRAWYRTKASA